MVEPVSADHGQTGASALAAADPTGALGRLEHALLQLWWNVVEQLPLILLSLLVLVGTGFAARLSRRLSRRLLAKTGLRGSLRDLFSRLIGLAVWVLGLLVAAMIVFPGFTFSQVLATAGLASIALGFAFKDIVESFFAGVLILWRFPFEVGDFIEVKGENVEGEVHDIWIRLTLLHTVKDELVIIPNAKLYKNEVVVKTWKSKRRVDITVGVAYDEDIDEARQVITKAMQSCSSVSKDHEIQVFAREFASSSIEFEVAWWAGSRPLDLRKSRDEVVAAIKRALNEAGIEIPFPYRTLTFKSDYPFHMANAGPGSLTGPENRPSD